MNHGRGFALLAVLWVTVALGALVAGTVSRAQLDASVTGASIVRMRTRWAAEGCLATALSRLEDSLRSRAPLAPPRRDTLVYANGTSCTTSADDPSASLDSRYNDGRLNLNTASDDALRALPGLGDEALRVIAEARAWHRPLRDLNDLTSRLAPPARAQMLGSYSELLSRTTFQISSLALTASAWVEGSPPASRIEVLVVAAGDRVAVVRRRMW
jgi:type II secretory pathway component PulK